MSVAVIIANLNNGQYIGDAVRSAVTQTVRPDEVIVVDGGSTDDSKAIVDSFADAAVSLHDPYAVRWIHTPPRKQADARNVGINHTDCEFIVPLDSDDWIEPAFIEKCLQQMRDPDVGVVATGLVWPHGQIQWPVEPMTPEAFLTGNRLFCCSLFRRICWEQVKGYSTDTKLFEDWLLWGMIAHRGWRFSVVREPLFHYRPHPGSSCDKMKHQEAAYRQRTIDALRSAYAAL